MFYLVNQISSSEQTFNRTLNAHSPHHQEQQDVSDSTIKKINTFSPSVWSAEYVKSLNLKYRNYFFPLSAVSDDVHSLAIFPQRIVSQILHYFDQEYEHNLYGIAPELMDPTIPLQQSFIPWNKKKFNASLQILNESKMGARGVVNFLQAKHDLDAQLVFAVKQPKMIRSASKLPIPRSQTILKSYINNVSISSRLENHPNFMKVFGIVIKADSIDYTPHLFMEYIEGEILLDLIENQKLSSEDKHRIVLQLKEAFLFLFRKGIEPVDAYASNLMLASDNQLKIIDFDLWKDSAPFSLNLAKSLYETACEICRTMIEDRQFNPPPFQESNDIEESFKTSFNSLQHDFFHFI